MQLDKTRIAIRERNMLDTMDLSLHVIRVYWRPLLVTMAIGVIPLMVIDYFAIGWMAASQDYFWDFPVRYVWHLCALLFIQAPLGSIFAVYWLGQAVFLDRPKIRTVVWDVCKLSPRIAWCQLLVRGVLPAWLIVLCVERQSEFNVGLEGFLLFLLVAYSAILRTFRPFVNEIVLLERNPLTAKSKSVMTIGRRCNTLHTPNSADLVVRGAGSALIGGLLTLAVFGVFIFLSGVFLNDWGQGPILLLVCLPLSLWIVAGYLAVFRFLSYLDVRIRQEGWEVELLLRAEASRLTASAIRLLLAGLLVCGLASPAAAQVSAIEDAVDIGRQALETGEYYPWYDYENDTIRRVDVVPPKDTATYRNSTWQAKPPKAKSASWSGWSLLREIFRSLLWAFLLLLAAGLVVALIRALLRSEGRGTAAGEPNSEVSPEEDLIEHLPFEVRRPRRDLLGEARRHYEQGNYGEAVIYLFSYELVKLDQHQRLRLTRGKTNRQYLREIWRDPVLRETFRHTMLAFEDVFFGHHDLDRDRFESCWSRLDEFHERLETAGTS